MLTNRLRHRITFQAQEQQQDSETGAVNLVWVNVTLADGTLLVDVPAEVLTGAGREFSGAATTQGETTARVNLRWFPGLELTWRLLWQGQPYNISSAETDATARKEWRLRCENGVTDGR
ncbi:MAG: head-tail adaptor protein [Pseudomonadota bacterium]